MNSQYRTLFVKTILSSALLMLAACSDYDPVPASKCSSVVQHAQKVLGEFAPEYATMMDDCKKASDKERGCVMAATKKGKIAQCM